MAMPMQQGLCPQPLGLASGPPHPLLLAATEPPPLPLAPALGPALSLLPTAPPACLGVWVCSPGLALLLGRLALVVALLLLTL